MKFSFRPLTRYHALLRGAAPLSRLQVEARLCALAESATWHHVLRHLAKLAALPWPNHARSLEVWQPPGLPDKSAARPRPWYGQPPSISVDELPAPGSSAYEKVLAKAASSPRGAAHAAQLQECALAWKSLKPRTFKNLVTAPLCASTVRLLAASHTGQGSSLVALWRVDITLLAPNGPAGGRSKQLEGGVQTYAVLQVTLHDAWELLSEHEHTLRAHLDATYEPMLRGLIGRALHSLHVARVAYLVAEDRESELDDNDCPPDWPLALELRYRGGNLRLSELLRSRTQALAEYFSLDEFTESFDDARNSFLFCRASYERLGQASAEVPDAPRAYYDGHVRAPGEPGDTAVLLEKEDIGLYVAEDGRVYSTEDDEERHRYVEDYGLLPEELLQECGLLSDKFARFRLEQGSSHAAVDAWVRLGRVRSYTDYLDEFLDEAAGPRTLTGDLFRALGLHAAPPGERKALRLWVLADQATDTAYGYLARSDETMESFLDAALAGGASLLHRRPRSLQVARNLLSRRPEVAQWCEKHGVEVAHPSSGFKNAAHVLRLWVADLGYVMRPIGSAVALQPALGAVNEQLQRLAWAMGVASLSEQVPSAERALLAPMLHRIQTSARRIQVRRYFAQTGRGSFEVEAAARFEEWARTGW